MNKRWSGVLTIDNVEEVGNMILEVLSGREYVFVSSYEHGGFEPVIHLNQSLENGTNGSPLSWWVSEDGKFVGFNFCDTYGVWGCFTSSVNGKYDGKFTSPYIVIDWGKITITQRAPNGLLRYWQIAFNQ